MWCLSQFSCPFLTCCFNFLNVLLLLLSPLYASLSLLSTHVFFQSPASEMLFIIFSVCALFFHPPLLFFSLPSPLRACLSWCRAAKREDTLMLSLLGWHNSTSLWGVKALTLPCLSVCPPGRLCSSPLSTSQTFPACRLVLALPSACLPACLSNKL